MTAHRERKKSSKLIVGLGNPRLPYGGTRHNIGAEAVERLAKELGLTLCLHRPLKSSLAKGKIGDSDVFLLLPQTFMNLSGDAVLALMKGKRISLNRLLVVCDDVALPLGCLRMRPRGSAGGHRGLASVIEKIGTGDFARLRLGIGSRDNQGDLSDYVLARFEKKEEPEVRKMLKGAVAAIEMWVGAPIDKCMSRFNRTKRE